MPAVMDIVRLTGTGGSETETVVTSGTTTLSQTDDPTPEVTDSIVLPAPAATTYSFWATFRMKCTSTPDGTADNLRAYTEADAWAGLGADLVGRDASTGANAGYRAAASAIVLNTTNHTGLDGAPADMSTYTEGSPLAMGGSIVNPNTGRWGDHLVLQVQVSDAAGSGPLPGWEIFMKRDET